MAIKCGVCGKSQTGWIANYPLANYENLVNVRICVECYNNISAISNTNAQERVVKYLNQMLDTNKDMTAATKDYVTALTMHPSNVDEYLKGTRSKEKERLKSIKLTSGYNYEGYNIVEYLDFLVVETAFGLGLFKGIAADLANLTGSESNAIKTKLSEAKESIMTEIRYKAANIGANAIIGVDFEYTMFGSSIVAVIISGTAVKIEPLKMYEPSK